MASEASEIIVSELFSPPDTRRIPAVTGKVGGFAGGEKYIYQGIFFKLTTDAKGIFGGNDDAAMKAGAHEWRSYLELADCRVAGALALPTAVQPRSLFDSSPQGSISLS